jgi:hypothetical protein
LSLLTKIEKKRGGTKNDIAQEESCPIYAFSNGRHLCLVYGNFTCFFKSDYYQDV